MRKFPCHMILFLSGKRKMKKNRNAECGRPTEVTCLNR